MSTHHFRFANSEEAFAIAPIPVWVTDIETLRVLWANDAAVEFWQSNSREELLARDMLVGIPEVALVRVRQTIRNILEGKVLKEQWTFFPKGKATPVFLHLRPITMPDGRLAMLNQGVKIEVDIDPSVIRALSMLHLSAAVIAFVDARGMIYIQNAASIQEFGDTKSWTDWIGDPTMARRILDGAIAGPLVEVETSVRTTHGERIHAIRANQLRDPVSGELGVFVQHFDVTERVEAERLVQAHLLTLREQQREILALSTPFLDVGANTLALPLVGRIDESRAAEITSRLLEMVANRGIERVILDITGVVSVDTSSIAFVRRLVDAVALLGAKPIVTGIRSDVARILAASDEKLSGITIKRSLADGLAVGRSSHKD